MNKTLVVDVDGTLFEYDKYEFGKFGKPKQDVIDFIREWKLTDEKNHVIAIQTTRSWAEYEQLKERLDLFKIPYDIINMGGKSIGLCYLDDRSVNIKDESWTDKATAMLFGDGFKKDGVK